LWRIHTPRTPLLPMLMPRTLISCANRRQPWDGNSRLQSRMAASIYPGTLLGCGLFTADRRWLRPTAPKVWKLRRIS
jgi:hypothetical protein